MRPWGLSLLSCTVYLFCPHPLTFEIPAAQEVELLDRHALQHLDVAWGTEWGWREGVKENEEGSWEGSSDVR